MVENVPPLPTRNWRLRLIRWLGLTPVPADVAGEVSALRTTVAALTQAQTANQTTITALRETLDRLERQIGRSGKEQFKANALAESQQQTVKTVLEQLRDAESYRERELASLRERLASAHRDGRLEIVKRLLSVADGLDEAMAAGERMGEWASGSVGVWANRQIGKSANRQISESTPSFGARWGQAWARLWGRAGSASGVEPSDEEQPAEAEFAGGARAAEASTPEFTNEMAAWLAGLKLVRERLLDLLAAEGVRPVEALGDAFDPYLHVVVETVPTAEGVPPGTIVRETRRGYTTGETVLRYAEVVVAR